MRSAIVAVLVVVAVVAGCASRKPVRVVTPLTEAETRAYTGSGSCTIQGQAFLKTRGGEVRYGAGGMVDLVPDVPLLKEVRAINMGGSRAELDPDVSAQWAKVSRATQADGEGRFEFRNVPCGKWFVEALVTWEVFGAYGISRQQGGAVSAFVDVTPEGSPARVVLTR